MCCTWDLNLRMKKCTSHDFKQLLDEILNCFLDHAGRYLRENNLLADADIKDEFEDFEQQSLIKLMAEYSPTQLSGGMYLVQDLLDIIEQIHDVIVKLNEYKQQQINDEYSRILNKYIDLIVDNTGFWYVYNSSLRRRINGIFNVRKRYQPLLDKKLDIFYSSLTAYVLKHGKFKNPSQAVQLILPELRIKFKAFDLQWIQSKLEANNQEILDLSEARKNNEKNAITENEDFDDFYDLEDSIKIQDRTYLNQINNLKNENKKLEQMLKDPDRYLPQQKQLPFNTVYIDEVLMNHLRRCPDLMREIIQ